MTRKYQLQMTIFMSGGIRDREGRKPERRTPGSWAVQHSWQFLENRGRVDQILHILGQDLILWFKLDILILYALHTLWQVVQRVLQLENLPDQFGFVTWRSCGWCGSRCTTATAGTTSTWRVLLIHTTQKPHHVLICSPSSSCSLE